MMSNCFRVHQRLPGLNQVINANRRNRYAGARLKRDIETAICWSIKKAVMLGECRKVTGPVRIRFTWYEKSRRRDLDNIFSAKKFILDAMQRMQIIAGYGQKYETAAEDIFVLSKNEGVYVEIMEADQPAAGLFSDHRGQTGQDPD